MKYYYADSSYRPIGPYEEEELRRLHLNGVVRAETQVIEEGGFVWKPFSQLLAAGAGAPPPVLPPPRLPDYKSRLAAGLLGVFLGCLGIHNFYLGYTGKALAQLLLTVLSCGCLGVVSGIWGMVEGIMILTSSISCDAAGVVLKD